MVRVRVLLLASSIASGAGTFSGAAAEHKSVHVTASGEAAATDNVFASPRGVDDATGVIQDAEADVSFTVRPGILFGYDAPRMTHDLSLEGELTEFLAHSDAPSISVRGSARSLYVTTEHTTLVTLISGQNGVVSALSSRLAPADTTPLVQPIGRVDTISGDASALLSYATGKDYTFSLTGFARASRTDGNEDDLTMGMVEPTITKSAEAGGTFGAERLFRAGDALSLQAGASILRLERDTDPSVVMGPRLDRQLDPRASLQWRHDYNRVWSHVLDAGAVYVHPLWHDPDNPGIEPNDGLFPVFGAAVAYTEVWGRMQLSARRDVAPNLFVAQNTVNETAALALAMPLPWLDNSRMRQPRLGLSSSLGLSRTRLINATTSDIEGSIKIARADVGLGFSPRPGLTLGLRYEFVYQTPDDQAVAAIPGFYRNTLSFTFSMRYPDRVAGAEVARRTTGGVRADGQDLVPIGTEPVVGDPGGGDGGDDN